MAGLLFGVAIFDDEGLRLEAIAPRTIDQRSAVSEPILYGMMLHSGALPPVFNPLAPLIPLRHAAIFELFPLWEGSLEIDMLVDFLGVRTPFEYDCEGLTDDGMRRASTPSTST